MHSYSGSTSSPTTSLILELLSFAAFLLFIEFYLTLVSLKTMYLVSNKEDFKDTTQLENVSVVLTPVNPNLPEVPTSNAPI